MAEAEIGVMHFEGGERDHKATNSSGHWVLKRMRRRIFPWSLQKELADTLTLCQ